MATPGFEDATSDLWIFTSGASMLIKGGKKCKMKRVPKDWDYAIMLSLINLNSRSTWLYLITNRLIILEVGIEILSIVLSIYA